MFVNLVNKSNEKEKIHMAAGTDIAKEKSSYIHIYEFIY